jgi:hypothetical protein
VSDTALAPVIVRDPELDRIARLGRWLAASETGSDAQAAREMSAALRLYYVHELGLPLQAASEVSVIKGRLFVGAKLLRAMAYRQGYRVIRMDGSNEYSCTAILIRTDTGERLGESTFTIEDAKRAGLVRGQSAWVSHPARMLWARASKFVLDDYAPEVTLGLGSEDEIPEYTGDARPPIGSQPGGRAEPVVAEQEPEEGEWWEPDHEPDPAAGIPEPAAAGPPAAAGRWLRKLQAAYRQHRITRPAARHEYATLILDRPVSSSKELTEPEIRELLEALDSSEAFRVALRERLADPVEPEPEPDTEQPEEELASPAQRTQIIQLFEERHLTGTQRLDLLSELTNRPIHAIDHLTSDEAGFVIQMLTSEGQTVMPER